MAASAARASPELMEGLGDPVLVEEDVLDEVVAAPVLVEDDEVTFITGLTTCTFTSASFLAFTCFTTTSEGFECMGLPRASSCSTAPSPISSAGGGESVLDPEGSHDCP